MTGDSGLYHETAGAKQAVLDLLLKAIQRTRAGADVTALRYNPEKTESPRGF